MFYLLKKRGGGVVSGGAFVCYPLLIPYKFLTPLLKLFKLGKSILTALSFFPEYNQSIIFFLLSL